MFFVKCVINQGFADKKRRFDERNAIIQAETGTTERAYEETQSEVARVEEEIKSNRAREEELKNRSQQKAKELKDRIKTGKVLEEQVASLDRRAQAADIAKAAQFIIHRIGNNGKSRSISQAS